MQSNTPVISIASKPDSEGRWTITTPRGNVAARNVVHATNAYAAHLLPEYTGRIVPVRGVCSRIVHPEGQHGSQHLVNTYGIRYSARDYDYLIPRADGSIVVGGARQMFWHKPELWFNNIRDDELVEEAGGYFDGYMQRTFRGWENSGATVDKVWTGSKFLLDTFPTLVARYTRCRLTSTPPSHSHGLFVRLYAPRGTSPWQRRPVHHCRLLGARNA